MKIRKHCLTVLHILSAVTAVLFSCAEAYAIPAKPSPARLVNDFAGVFSSSQTATLEEALVAYDDSTSTQIAVVTVDDLEGYQAAEYATRIGLEWQVGSERFDNGVVILVKPKTRRESGEVFIAVGYGLEGAIPDARARSIINSIMIPRFIEDDYYGAVAGACKRRRFRSRRRRRHGSHHNCNDHHHRPHYSPHRYGEKWQRERKRKQRRHRHRKENLHGSYYARRNRRRKLWRKFRRQFRRIRRFRRRLVRRWRCRRQMVRH